MSAHVYITGIPGSGLACGFANSAHPGLHSKDIARFWAKVRQAPNGCWEWTASRVGGGGRKLYGQFTYILNGQQVHVYAHRFAWQVAHGPIPAGHYICHICDNGVCVRDDHLFLGTQFDNMRDASAKGRLAVPRLRTRGFKAEVIAAYLAGGVTAQALAAAYDIHKLTVHRWIRTAMGNADQRRRVRHQRSAA